MSSGAGPTITPARYYFLEPGEVAGEYTIASNAQSPLSVQDLSDGPQDNLGIFGDISRDDIVVGGGAEANVEYVGKTSRPGEFILVDDNNTPYIFTENTYSFGQTINDIGGTYAVCYVSGTKIRTSTHDIAVENLKVGDVIVTASGEARPVRWIGHRTVVCNGRADLLPVRIAAGAFGPSRPTRDLFVSPAHAICVDAPGEVLIPACRLINGTTVTQVDMESVTYWHIELESHDILLAEGLPAESYLDCGNRRFFANADVTELAALPDARPQGPLPFCRPFHEAGPVVERVRADLQERAVALGWRKVEKAFAGLHVVADGRIVLPEMDGLVARFTLPPGSRDVRLVSKTSVPAHVIPGVSDDRRLGVAVHALLLDDGSSSPRRIALDDPRLTGFHALDGEGTQRWTDGNASLTAALWAAGHGSLTLQVELAVPALLRWVAPGETAGVVSRADRRQA